MTTENENTGATDEGIAATVDLDYMTTGPMVHADMVDGWNRTVTFVKTNVEGVAFAVASTDQQGIEVKKLDWREDYHEEYGPPYVDTVRTVRDLDSLLAEAERRPLILSQSHPAGDGAFRGSSTVTAFERANRVQVMYDDDEGGPGGPGYYRAAGRRKDRLELALALDPDWVAWHELSGKRLSQEDLGDALEELAHTIVVPASADFLGVIDHIRVSSDAKFEGRVNRHNGALVMAYQEDVNVTADTLEVPQEILIRCRVFEGYPIEYDVPAWFRVKVSGGKLSLSVKLKPTRRIRLAAWADVCKEIGEALGVPVLQS